MAEKKISVKNLRISFRTSNGKVQAVRDISFDLYKGETLAIVDRAYLICNGEILFTGDSESLVNDENARRVYLGPSFENK